MINSLPQHLITPVISFISIILGAIIGGIFGWFTTKRSTDRNIEVQNKIVEDNRKYQETVRKKRSRQYANIIRLDLCTAIFQSIRLLKSFRDKNNADMYPVPMDGEYSSGVAYLKNEFDLKELSYIYQLYGIIEKLNRDTNEFNYYDNNSYNLVKIDCTMLLKKLYGENLKKAVNMDIDSITYKQLYENEIIKKGYRNILAKLDEICSEE
ncbi:hypothetical protein Ccar_12875 [Clostridium carboxidivorans P7]|uniref:Uncharacterized protein n=1 Tax=Clostridium carboxidivorans P7 TaxID=536227 RepID=C6PRD0_9CLOT|nr:hypothetical protein [Clostridium carboxidivorans]AKN31705.1 hypothetical protein Ccar_12875 [Clostridium carboxidivorans P7]EET88230.1 conserved hypothetical protein [Clostridium carboxidivorans P7]EFG87473.1 hypothetical protein CLCAR_3006 [Clostridium carboxidivorans P7]